MARYDRVEDVIRLLLELGASDRGLSLDEIGDCFGVSRRTSERMLGAARRLFPEMRASIGADGRKYWRLRDARADGLARIGSRELDALEAAAERLGREGDAQHASTLRMLESKLRARATDAPQHSEPEPARVCTAFAGG